MRDILKYSLVLFTAWMTLSGCQKFTEPEPYQRADMESNMTLKDFKALYAGTPVEFADTTSIVLEGKIISSDRSGNLYRTLYIEDSTAGIEVKIGKTGLYNDYKMGQTLYIQPRGLCLGDYNGVLQIGLKSYDSEYETTWIDVQTIIDRTVFRGDAGEPLPPTDIMSKSQITDAMLCRYVRIMGFTYQGGDNGLQTWAVSDDQGRTVVRFSFLECLDALCLVSTHGNRCYIAVTIFHNNLAEVLLGLCLTTSCELRNGSSLGGLGGLTTSVGVNFCIENENVDIQIVSHDMIKSAVANIICPAIATDDPYGLGDEVSLHFEQNFDIFVGRSFNILDEGVYNSTLCISVITCCDISLEVCCKSIFNLVHVLFHCLEDLAGLVGLCNSHTEAVFSIIFEQGVSPCNTVAILVRNKWCGRCSRAVDHGAACCVGNEHILTEQLGSQSVVWSFTASWAAAGYFEVRHQEGCTSNCVLVAILSLVFCFLVEVISKRFCTFCFNDVNCRKSLCRTCIDTYTTAYAVHRRELDSVNESIFLGTLISRCWFLDCPFNIAFLGNGFSLGSFFLVQQEWTDCCMRADECALTTFNALGSIPCWNHSSDVSLFLESNVFRNRTIDDIWLHEVRNLHIITTEGIDNLNVCIEVIITCQFEQCTLNREVAPFWLDCNFNKTFRTLIDSCAVVVNNIITLTSICLAGRILHEFYCCAVRHDLLIELEESTLQDCVCMTTHVCFLSKLVSIDDEELSMMISKTLQHSVRQSVFNFISGHCCIQEECTAILEVADHVELECIGFKRAGDEVCLIDVVRRMNRALTKSQMASCNAASLLGVICEVCLRIEISIVTDDLDSGLVSTDCTIGTKTIEQAGCIVSINLDINRFKGEVCNIIFDTDCELFLRFILLEFFKDSIDIGWVCVLGRKTITTTDECDVLVVAECIFNIKEQWFTWTNFLCTVKNSNLLSCSRNSF